jgi:hypothetical protein
MFAATLLAAGAVVGLAGATHGSDVRVSVGSPPHAVRTEQAERALDRSRR